MAALMFVGANLFKTTNPREILCCTGRPVRRKRTGKAKASACSALNDDGAALVGEEEAEALQDLRVHGGGDFAGLRVLLAGVVDTEETGPGCRKLRFGAVAESVGCARSDDVALL